MSIHEPLRFEPIFLEKVWGGRSLGSFLGADLPEGEPIGEVWSLVDRDEHGSVVASGSYAGRSLRGLMLSERDALLGETRPASDGSFPLLIKYLEVAAPLSVQVHPDAKAVEALRGGAEEKNECWYVLDAEPGSRVHLGFQGGLEPAAIAAAAHGSEFCSLLKAHEVRTGDFIHVPAGTVHAIGAGLTLVEVQQNSDTTYRIYDWDRVGLDGKPRELHIEQALRAIDYQAGELGPVHPSAQDPGALCPVTPFLDSDHFGVSRIDIGSSHELRPDGRARVVVVLAGQGSMQAKGRGASPDHGPWEVLRGQTWLLPACFEAFELTSVDGELSVLDVETKA